MLELLPKLIEYGVSPGLAIIIIFGLIIHKPVSNYFKGIKKSLSDLHDWHKPDDNGRQSWKIDSQLENRRKEATDGIRDAVVQIANGIKTSNESMLQHFQNDQERRKDDAERHTIQMDLLNKLVTQMAIINERTKDM